MATFYHITPQNLGERVLLEPRTPHKADQPVGVYLTRHPGNWAPVLRLYHGQPGILPLHVYEVDVPEDTVGLFITDGFYGGGQTPSTAEDAWLAAECGDPRDCDEFIVAATIPARRVGTLAFVGHWSPTNGWQENWEIAP